MISRKLLILSIVLISATSGFSLQGLAKTVSEIMQGLDPVYRVIDGRQYSGYYIWNQPFTFLPGFKLRGGFVSEEAIIDAYQSSEGRLVSNDCFIARDTLVLDHAQISGRARILDRAKIMGGAKIADEVRVFGDAVITDQAFIGEQARISGMAVISGNARVYGNAKVFGQAKVYGHVSLYHWARIFGDTELCGNVQVGGDVSLRRTYKCDSSRLWMGSDHIKFALF